MSSRADSAPGKDRIKTFIIAPPLALDPPPRFLPRMPPFTALSVAGQLKRSGGDAEVFDAFLNAEGTSGIVAAAGKSRPDCIAVCAADLVRIIPVDVLGSLVDALKSAFPRVPLAVFGMAQPRSWMDALFKRAARADYVLLGDPEESMAELTQAIAGGSPVSRIAGVAFHSADGSFSGCAPRLVDDLDLLAPPAWELVDLARYAIPPHRRKGALQVYVAASRGCPWNRCMICGDVSNLKSGAYRTRKPASVAAEIGAAARAKGAIEVQFTDACFNTDPVWLEAFGKALKKDAPGVRWSCLCRVDRIDRERAALMRAAGCWNISFGIETRRQDSLDRMDKGQRVEQAAEAVRACRRQGIETTGSFLIGIPGEGAEDAVRSASFAVSIGLDYAEFFIVKWYDPDCPLLPAGCEPGVWENSRFEFCGSPAVTPPYTGGDGMRRARAGAYLRFYSDPRTVMRHLARVRSRADIARLFAALRIIAGYGRERWR